MDSRKLLRAATPADEPAIAETLARAFDLDPPLNWLLRQDHRRVAAFREFFGTAFRRMALPHGCVDIAEQKDGVALWVPPGRWELGYWTQLALAPAFVRVLGTQRLLSRLSAIQMLQKHHPREPHYYLLAMGVLPERQGQGLGSALLRQRLALCDAEGSAAYLEASTRSSRALYERMGFVTRQEILMPPDAPPVWAMWREPSKASR